MYDVPVDHLAWKMIDDVACTSLLEWKIIRQYVHLFGGLKVRKSPKVQNSMKTVVSYNPFYVPQGAGPIIKPKSGGLSRKRYLG